MHRMSVLQDEVYALINSGHIPHLNIVIFDIQFYVRLTLNAKCNNNSSLKHWQIIILCVSYTYRLNCLLLLTLHALELTDA